MDNCNCVLIMIWNNKNYYDNNFILSLKCIIVWKFLVFINVKKIMYLKKIENIVNIIFLFESFNIFIILISKLLKEV